VIEWVRTGTHRTRQVAERIDQAWGASVGLGSLRRLFKANKLSYKRIRRSCRHLRDAVAYEFFRTEVGALRDWAASGEIDRDGL